MRNKYVGTRRQPEWKNWSCIFVG